ncbi:MAG: BREX-1 system adenine-specific DNA-methyltransferase PglX [Flavobacteriales bacterium]|jgi:hypothetical protein
MNTNNLKRFAKEARIKLLDQVSRKLEYVLSHDTAELRGKQKEIEQLKKKISEQGKEQVIEMVAYTWFNRLMALRFMDANGYTIPKVITPLDGMTNPEVLQNALGGNIEPELKLDRQRLNDLLDGKTAATDAHTEAYKMLLVASCNQWHTAMPFMFERISDFTELLLPDDLLSDYSIVADMRSGMTDEDCQQEELIGWLYQFYIADKKDDVFEGLKKNIKITAENIPAATQLFTPRWIVRYMVENTLGKLWLTLKPNSKLRQFMPYYIEAPEGNAPAPLPEGIKGVTDITFLDPCQGSGHVLVYAFDLFTKIYEEEGYNTNEIPALILEHNLFGIDIDERAAQLAAFALTMKARSYYSRFLRKPVQPHVIALENVNEDVIKHAVKLPLAVASNLVYDYKDLTLYNLTQADNFGSLIQIDPEELKALQIQNGSIWQEQEQKLKEQAEYLSRQYHCVVTNPPYMGSRNMNDAVKEYVQSYFPNTKRDLFSAFIERCASFSILNGLYSLINQHTWMFTSDFYNFRCEFLKEQQLINVIHLGSGVFDEISGEVVQSVSFVCQKNIPCLNHIPFYDCTSIRGSEAKAALFQKIKFPFLSIQSDFEALETKSFAYWITPKTADLIKRSNSLASFADVKQGLATGMNDRFLRLWYEVSFRKIELNRSPNSTSNYKWFPYNKGGGYQKFYGSNEYVCNWENDGHEIKNFKDENGKVRSRAQNSQFYFKRGITFNLTGGFSTRYKDDGFLFDVQGSSLFPTDEYIYPLIGFLNSKLVQPLLRITNPTMVTQVGDLKLLPIAFDNSHLSFNELSVTSKELVSKYKFLWDINEFSWDFQPFGNLERCEFKYLKEFNDRFNDHIIECVSEIRNTESKLNELLINIYGLAKEYDSSIKYSDISVANSEIMFSDEKVEINFKETTYSFISFFVGNLFGRFSLDTKGIVLANQNDTLQNFLKQVSNPTFMPDEDNIIPVLDGEWFTDDIVGRFKVFLKAAFGEEHFEENLKYIEDTIGKDIRKYFVKDFYNEHIKRYKKRPIYWMFSSPKGHFKALIYMHRYQPDLCSKMLNDYLQAFISKLEATKQTQTMLSLREDISAREKTAALKEIDKLELIIKDCREYEKTLFTIATQKICIDLDDGVKVNYQKFKEVLVPIKGLEKEEE